MADIIGGAMMVVGGASMAVGSRAYVRAVARRPVDVARDLIGDSSAAVPTVLPPDLVTLLDQIP